MMRYFAIQDEALQMDSYERMRSKFFPVRGLS